MYPVEALGFEFALGNLPPLSLDGHRGKLSEPPALFDEANGRLANMLQYAHNRTSNHGPSWPWLARASPRKKRGLASG